MNQKKIATLGEAQVHLLTKGRARLLKLIIVKIAYLLKLPKLLIVLHLLKVKLKSRKKICLQSVIHQPKKILNNQIKTFISLSAVGSMAII